MRIIYLEIDNCASNPCNNHGTCVNAKNGYQCDCKAGFRGENCDDEVGLCHTSPCYSSAECVDKVGETMKHKLENPFGGGGLALANFFNLQCN